MRKVLFTLLFVFAIFAAKAQNKPFAPPGAEWYYDAPNGIFHDYVVDTQLIQGHVCSKIVQKGIAGPPYNTQGFRIYDLHPLYVYNSGDTVFVFNHIFNRFTPLYVFNVMQGDTVRLPILDLDAPCNYFNISIVDSSFYFVVDSVRLVQYDTALLKTVYSHSIKNAGHNSANLGWGSLLGGDINIYAEKIGSLTSLTPQCHGDCNCILDQGYQTPTSLRCYHDTLLRVKLVPGSCDKDIVTGVPDVAQTAPFSIYPNPATDAVILSMSNGATYSYNLTDSYGRLLLSGTVKGKEILYLKGFAKGLYWLHVIDKKGQRWNEKVALQ